MQRAEKRNWSLLVAVVLLSSGLSGCLGVGGKKKNPTDTSASAEPDKILYQRATEDMKKGRYTVARLSLQTLINTYPDSEYLAKAKLAVADSYYKEAGTTGLTQAISEYKDFVTFFPFLDEAAYAQMQVAMAHYRMMEKPDRDSTQARAAEDELQTFLLKYPQSPLVPQSEQRLREVQEVLAEGDYRVARFYYIKSTPSGYRAAAARMIELTDRYPLYSQSDHALWMLGDIYERAERREVADRFYERLVRDYPLSPLVSEAKQKLIADNVPVPQPDPNALARMQKEQQMPHPRRALLKNPLSILKSGPDVASAAHSGQPNLNPPSESVAASEVLKPGSTGQVGQVGGSGTGGGGGSSVAVETVPAGSANSTTPPAAGAQPGTETNPATKPGAGAPSAPGDPASANQPAAGSAQAGDPKPAKSAKADKKKESTSKKKKGLRKIIPW